MGSMDVTTRVDVVLETFGAPCQAGRTSLWEKGPRCHLRLTGARLVIQRRFEGDWKSLGGFFKLFGGRWPNGYIFETLTWQKFRKLLCLRQ